MTKNQKIAIFHQAIFQYLNNEDFHLDVGDIEAALQSDSVEDVNEAYRLIDQDNFQNKVKDSVKRTREYIANRAIDYEEDPIEDAPFPGYRAGPDGSVRGPNFWMI